MCIFILGCNAKALQPTEQIISVQLFEQLSVDNNAGRCVVYVYYDNHYYENRTALAVLRNEEEIKAYERQVQFLQEKLKEAREKCKTTSKGN